MIGLHPPLPPGAPAAVVVVPGIAGTVRATRALAAALSPLPVAVAVRRPAPGGGRPLPIPERAEALAARLTSGHLPERLVVAGHSLGAYVAMELVRLLESLAPETACTLVVAGQLPPHRLVPHADDGLDDATVLRKVTGGGPPEQVASDPALLKVLIGQWRADYRAIDAYKPRPVPRVAADLHVWTADGDPSAPHGEAMAHWDRYTCGPAAFERFDGSHDFLFTRVGPVAERLRRLATAKDPVTRLEKDEVCHG